MSQNLTQGPIVPSLLRMALPIIGMSFVQMAYNMVDMIWLGRVGADAVAAAGTAGFVIWFGASLMLTMKFGVEITVSQAVGRKDWEKASSYACNAIFLAVLFATFYGLVTYILAEDFIAFFDLESISVNEMAVAYIRIIALGAPFFYINPVLAGVFTGSGNTQLPFRISSTGLLLNIIIDPLFIFGFGPIPALGVQGAAMATVLSQGFVTLLAYQKISSGQSVIQGFKELFLSCLFSGKTNNPAWFPHRYA